MTEINKTYSEQKSYMSITGRSAIYALGIAIAVVILLMILYSLMSILIEFFEATTFDFTLFFNRAFFVLKLVGLFVTPIVFILAFALLQRFRIK